MAASNNFKMTYTKKEMCVLLEVSPPTLNSWLRDICGITVYSGRSFTPRQVNDILYQFWPEFKYNEWKNSVSKAA